MIRFNFYLQSVLCGIGLILGLMTLKWEVAFYCLLYLLIPIGFTQYLGGLILLIIEKTRTPLVIGYFFGATLTLFILFNSGKLNLLWVLPPMLAILYWYISFQLLKQSRS